MAVLSRKEGLYADYTHGYTSGVDGGAMDAKPFRLRGRRYSAWIPTLAGAFLGGILAAAPPATANKYAGPTYEVWLLELSNTEPATDVWDTPVELKPVNGGAGPQVRLVGQDVIVDRVSILFCQEEAP
jgi:hypothetical protein